MRSSAFVDIICVLLKKIVAEDFAILPVRRIAKSMVFIILGILSINNVFILLALFLYNYLLSIPLSMGVATLISGIVFLSLALIFFATACKILSVRSTTGNIIIKDMLNAFLVGFKQGR